MLFRRTCWTTCHRWIGAHTSLTVRIVSKRWSRWRPHSSMINSSQSSPISSTAEQLIQNRRDARRFPNRRDARMFPNRRDARTFPNRRVVRRTAEQCKFKSSTHDVVYSKPVSQAHSNSGIPLIRGHFLATHFTTEHIHSFYRKKLCGKFVCLWHTGIPCSELSP